MLNFICMRLDKFLKIARIFKRRTISNKVCDSDKVMVNGKIAKPSKKVKIDDIITVSFGKNQFTVKIIELPTGNVSKENATNLFEIIEERHYD